MALSPLVRWCASAQAARIGTPVPISAVAPAVIKADPFVVRGLADFRIIEFRASQRAADIQKLLEQE